MHGGSDMIGVAGDSDWETTGYTGSISHINVYVSASWPRILETPNQVEDRLADTTATPAADPEMKKCVGAPVSKKKYAAEDEDVSDAESTASSWVQDS